MKSQINLLKESLEEELFDLCQLERQMQEELKNSIEGSLHISLQTKRNSQYYLYLDKKRTYLPASNMDIICELAQKSYNQSALALIEPRIHCIKKLLKMYETPIEKLYDDLPEPRKILVSPAIDPDEVYIKKWREQNPGFQNSYPYDKKFFTSQNEPVRSKSEILLADLFYRLGIPYVIEPAIYFDGDYPHYPDFYLLDVHNHKTYVYKHFGMMDNSEYASENIFKINQ